MNRLASIVSGGTSRTFVRSGTEFHLPLWGGLVLVALCVLAGGYNTYGKPEMAPAAAGKDHPERTVAGSADALSPVPLPPLSEAIIWLSGSLPPCLCTEADPSGGLFSGPGGATDSFPKRHVPRCSSEASGTPHRTVPLYRLLRVYRI